LVVLLNSLHLVCPNVYIIGQCINRGKPEYPDVKIYTVHPGVIATQIYHEAKIEIGATDTLKLDTLELPAATFLWLTARNAEFLSGR
jgi:hypothetical protein